MKKMMVLLVGWLLCITQLHTSSLSAYDGCAPCVPCGEECYFSIVPYVWTPWLEGSVTLKGTTAHVNTNIFDLIEESDSLAVFMLRNNYQAGCWGAYVDILYCGLGFEKQPGLPDLTIDMDFDLVIGEFGGTYRLWQRPSEYDGSCCSTLDVLVGGRYTYYKVDFKVNDADIIKQTIDWLDPIVGTRFIHRLAPCWDLLLEGDIGGFGAGSDFSWSALGAVRYNFCMGKRALILGYRGLYQDYKKGTESNRNAVHLTMHGPVIGLSFIF